MKYLSPSSDIFLSGAECLVNPVNCVGVMGKGLAKAFADKIPVILEPYRKACAAGTLVPGTVQILDIAKRGGTGSAYNPDGLRFVANLPTKNHWVNVSRAEWIDTGLAKLVTGIRHHGIRSIAVPMLGSGLGGLDWKRDVLPLVEKHLRPLSEEGVSVIVYGDGPDLAHDRSAASKVGPVASPTPSQAAPSQAAPSQAAPSQPGALQRSGSAVGMPHTAFYVVGDIHGMADPLKALLESIRDHAAQRYGSAPNIAFVGDYIDRGHDSLRVINLLLADRAMSERAGSRRVYLRGNHDDFLLHCIDNPNDQATFDLWMMNGGEELLVSYGVARSRSHGPSASAIGDLVASMPKEHLDFFRSLDLIHETDRNFFVHAGLNPAAPLDRSAETLLWIREPFLSQAFDFGKPVVHGHTITRNFQVEDRGTRINVDTGAFRSGRLSAALVDGPRLAHLTYDSDSRSTEIHPASEARGHALPAHPPASSARATADPAPVDVLTFKGERFAFLSNMYRADVSWGDALTPSRTWKYTEIPYVLAKTLDPQARKALIEQIDKAELEKPGSSPYLAKKLGRSLPLRRDWDDVKVDIMTGLVRSKFKLNPHLMSQLFATGTGHIQEGNTWGDTFWGVALNDMPSRGIRKGDGENVLGRILMDIRDEERVSRGLPPKYPVTAFAPTLSQAAPSPAFLEHPFRPEDIPSVVNAHHLKGKTLDDSYVDISRRSVLRFSDGTRLGNPFVMNSAGGKDGSREDVITKYAAWLSDQLKKPGFADWLATELRGKKLKCFCAPQACHGDVLSMAVAAQIRGDDPQQAIAPFVGGQFPSNLASSRDPAAQTAQSPAGALRPIRAYAGIGSRGILQPDKTRVIPDEIKAKIAGISRALAADGAILRSGAAEGCDSLFEEGCAAAGGKREIFVPWRAFGESPVKEVPNFAGVPEIMSIAAKHHPTWGRLKDSHKKLHARNVCQVLGRTADDPVDVVICWTETGEATGGTGQALRIAGSRNIPIINLGNARWKSRTAEEIVASLRDGSFRHGGREGATIASNKNAVSKPDSGKGSAAASRTGRSAGGAAAARAVRDDELLL